MTTNDLFCIGNLYELNENSLITYSTHMYDQIISSADFSRDRKYSFFKGYIDKSFLTFIARVSLC